MASVNGISLKNVRSWEGWEGSCSQGNIYLGSKKIGFWTMDDHGGEDEFHLDDGYSLEKLQNKIKELHPGKKTISFGEDSMDVEYDIEELMTDILSLKERETFFKKAQKSGRGAFIATDGYHTVVWEIPKGWSEEKTRTEIAEKIAKAKEGFFRNKTHETIYYTEASQFDVGEKITLDDIKA